MNTNKNLIVPNTTPTSIQQVGDHNLGISNNEGGIVNIIQSPTTDHNEDGVPYTPITHVRFDNHSNIIFLGNEQVKIPVELVQPGLLKTEELPYIHALCDAYADKLGKATGEITPDNISNLPKSIQHHFSSQRKAFYQAEFVKHVARETFADGDRQFTILKEDAYAGIEDTYYDDHLTGYDRLKAVLERITTISLTKSALMNVVGLIGNLEKKGICHIMVNDETIKSWVDINE